MKGCRNNNDDMSWRCSLAVANVISQHILMDATINDDAGDATDPEFSRYCH